MSATTFKWRIAWDSAHVWHRLIPWMISWMIALCEVFLKFTKFGSNASIKAKPQPLLILRERIDQKATVYDFGIRFRSAKLAIVMTRVKHRFVIQEYSAKKSICVTSNVLGLMWMLSNNFRPKYKLKWNPIFMCGIRKPHFNKRH